MCTDRSAVVDLAAETVNAFISPPVPGFVPAALPEPSARILVGVLSEAIPVYRA